MKFPRSNNGGSSQSQMSREERNSFIWHLRRFFEPVQTILLRTMFIITSLILIVTTLNIIFYYLQPQQEDDDDIKNSLSLPSHQLCRRFSLAEIKLATHDFDEAFVIGKGGFGKVYKGIIDTGCVAMKRLNCDSSQGEPEFRTEISMLSEFRHSHLVSLIGYCKAGQEMILVYEYMSNGTLADHLHKTNSNRRIRNSSLSWDERLNICIDAARGLDYLHTGTSVRQRVIHRDVKSSNILLDENLAAKISDFGLSRIGPSNLVDTTHVYTNMIRGTFGYMDEDYFLTRRLTRKSDVYAFGVVLFEVLSGRPAVDPTLGDEQRALAGWARRCTREGTVINKLMDPCLRGRILPTCLEAFVEIADRCILKCPKDRPTMAEVVARLEYAFALHRGIINRSAVEGNNSSSAVAGLSSEVQEVISHSYSSTLQEVTGANNGSLLNNELIIRDGASTSAGRVQQFIGRTKKKRIVRKIWSMFSAKTTAKPIEGGGLSSETSVLHDDIRVDEITEALRLEISIIEVATENFSEDNKIRQSATCSMYKGRLQNGQGIVVKRFHSYTQQVLKEYRNEISLLAKLEHDNVVQLLGYCVEGAQVLLVYTLVVYASLDLLMFDFATRVLLDWNRRHQIILGVALGLRYIHNHAPFQIVHFDVKPASILLEENLNPKLSDFGLARSSADNIMQSREYSPSVDVFKFGLLVLEIIRGQRSDEDFIHYAWRNWWKGTASNIIDPTMDVDSSIITRYIQIGLLCLQLDATKRPTMDEVIVMLLRGSSLTLQIPEKPVMLSLQSSDSDKDDDDDDLETLEPHDENDPHTLMTEAHNSETLHDFIQELNLNPR